MKTEQWLQTLERFFLDILGTLVPGLLLLEPLLRLVPSSISRSLGGSPTDTSLWCTHIVLGYVLGHVVTSIGYRLLGRRDKSRDSAFADTETFKSVARYVIARFPYFKLDNQNDNAVHQLRNVALSLIDPDDRQTVVRFMFISLLNLGAFTSLSIVASINLIGLLLRRCGYLIDWQFSPWIFAALPCLPFLADRRQAFYERAIRVQFSMVVGRILREQELARPDDPIDASSGTSVVYLAGGFHSGWQDKVVAALPGIRFQDPRAHQLKSPAAFTTWDLDAIKTSQWLFAYIEHQNPGLYALALEVGFAKGLGKRVILVEEKATTGGDGQRHLAMVRAAADVTFEALDEGIDFLRQIETLRAT